MALSPTNNAALLQEVDEAVRKDQLDSIWERFGRWIIAGVVAALIAFGGYLYWGHAQDRKSGENAEALVAAAMPFFEPMKTIEPPSCAFISGKAARAVRK